MSNLTNFDDFEEFARRYLKPLLVDALQLRLDAARAGPRLPPGTIGNPSDSEWSRSGVSDGAAGEPRFTRTSRGWTWQDRSLVSWQTDGPLTHRRTSEQEQRYDVLLSRQPDMAGVPRLTVDLHAVRTSYERDAVAQRGADGETLDLGAGWARLTLRWSLRLQLVVTSAGRANVVSCARRVAPHADAGRSGPYVTADPLGRLLDVRCLARNWERGAASLGAVQDQLVSRLAAAIEPPLARQAHHAYG